jgi:tetratricopeptide (TPR) repeat protein
MSLRTRGAARAAPPLLSRSTGTSPRRITPRFAALLCLAAVVAVTVSATLQSGAYQDWRLSRMSLPALQQELQARGQNARLLYTIGMRLDQQGRFAEADGYLRQSVGLDPDTPRLRDEWARALLGSGQITAAFGELREFAGTHPNLPEAHFHLGKFYYTQRSMKRACEEFERVVALNPEDGEAYLCLSGAADSLNDLTRAVQAAERAVALKPKSAEAHLAFAALCARTGRPPEQIRSEFQQAVTLASQNAVMHQEYARWLLKSARTPDDRQQAAAQASQAIALGVTDAAAYLILGRARLYNGDRAGAVEPLTHAAEMAPEDPAPALTLSQIQRALNHPAEAAAWEQSYLRRQKLSAERNRLLIAVTVDPDDPARKLRLARWLGLHGDADGCVHNYSMALHRALDAPRVLRTASHDLVQGGYADRALPLALRAVQATRHSPDAHEALGDALLKLNRLKEATEEYNQAIVLEPNRSPTLITRLRRYTEAYPERVGGQKIVAYTEKAPQQPQEPVLSPGVQGRAAGNGKENTP